MQTAAAIEWMADKAKHRAGWNADMTYRPLTDGDGLGAAQPGIDRDKESEERKFAEGVEAALLWVLRRTGEPLPSGDTNGDGRPSSQGEPDAGFWQLDSDEVKCALRTLAELRDDPHADLSERQVEVADRVTAIWRHADFADFD